MPAISSKMIRFYLTSPIMAKSPWQNGDEVILSELEYSAGVANGYIHLLGQVVIISGGVTQILGIAIPRVSLPREISLIDMLVSLYECVVSSVADLFPEEEVRAFLCMA